MGLFNRKPKMNPFEMTFWDLYGQSLRLKDQCALNSALQKRREACRLAENRAVNCDGYIGMAYHNLAVLALHHMANGRDAADFARKSLDDGDAYYELSEKRIDILQFSAHLESVQTAAITATSYDEAISYIETGARLYGRYFNSMLNDIVAFRKNEPRYGIYQRAYSLSFYSRVSAEQDKGDYSPALGLMEIMLDNAEKPDYDYSYEEYVDILDDYTFITIMMLLKKGQILNANGLGNRFAYELSDICREPLRKLAEFIPDCQPSDRMKFDTIINAYSTIPGAAALPEFAPFR